MQQALSQKPSQIEAQRFQPRPSNSPYVASAWIDAETVWYVSAHDVNHIPHNVRQATICRGPEKGIDIYTNKQDPDRPLGNFLFSISENDAKRYLGDIHAKFYPYP